MNKVRSFIPIVAVIFIAVIALAAAGAVVWVSKQKTEQATVNVNKNSIANGAIGRQTSSKPNRLLIVRDSGIYLADIDGKNINLLLTTKESAVVSLSPDRKNIVVSGDRNILALNLSKKNSIKIVEDAPTDMSFAHWIDGNRFVLDLGPTPGMNSQISHRFVAWNVDGEAVKELKVPLAAFYVDVLVAPDLNHIAYEAYDDHNLYYSLSDSPKSILVDEKPDSLISWSEDSSTLY